jgi:hypothetical protein
MPAVHDHPSRLARGSGFPVLNQLFPAECLPMQFDQRPPTDQRRMLIFFALALPIWIAGLMWMQRGQESAERQAQPRQEIPGTGRAGRGILRPPAPAGRRAPAAGGGGGAEACRPLRPRTDLETVKLTTESFEIEFSPGGAVPVRWTLVDPRATNGRHKSRRPSEEDSPVEPGEGIDLIDPDLAAYGLPLPFEVDPQGTERQVLSRAQPRAVRSSPSPWRTATTSCASSPP